MTKDQERQQALLNCAEAIKSLLETHGEFGAALLCMAIEIMFDGKSNDQSREVGKLE